MRNRWLGRAAITLVLIAAAAIAWSRRSPYQPLDVGSEAPAFAARLLDGDSVRVADYRGRVVLLNIWATWCRPCVREMPALQRLYDDLSDEGLEILAVSVDNLALSMGDPVEAVRGFVREFNLTFPILLDPENRIESVYQIPGYPTTYVIDRDGVIRRKFLGERNWDQPEFAAEIRRLLQQES